MRGWRWRVFECAGLVAGALVLALAASWTSLGTQIDKDAYDWMYRIYRPPDPVTQSIVLGTDQVARLTAAKGNKPPFDVAFFDTPQVLEVRTPGERDSGRRVASVRSAMPIS